MNDIIKSLLKEPQVSCPVAHHFGKGIYIREITIPQGTLIVGRYHKFPHLNIMLRGVLSTYDSQGQSVELKPPLIFESAPGRKFGYAVETVVWLNVYATNETDIEKLEKELYIESIEDYDITHMITDQSNNDESCKKKFPDNNWDTIAADPDNFVEFNRLTSIINVRNSSIHGKGIFLSVTVKANTVIDVLKINNKRLKPTCRFINHSDKPNCRAERRDLSGNLYLISDTDIFGCIGGGHGTELTVDYRLTPQLFGVYRK